MRGLFLLHQAHLSIYQEIGKIGSRLEEELWDSWRSLVTLMGFVDRSLSHYFASLEGPPIETSTSQVNVSINEA